jgi:hypothetical protein
MEKLELPEEIPSGLVFKLGVTLCTHPLEVSKTLIQVLYTRNLLATSYIFLSRKHCCGSGIRCLFDPESGIGFFRILVVRSRIPNLYF